jgi:hypothetical protein
MNLSRLFPRIVLAFVFAALSALGACGNCAQSGPCTSDFECDATGQGFQACDLDSGLCVCKDDRACGPDEFCNAVGRCQTVSGCGTNDDCGGGDSGLFCDVTTSQCLSLLECSPEQGQSCCSLDSQCPFRQICDTLTLTCVEGCRGNADCLIGEGCTGAGFGALGVCGTRCTDDNLCANGELCNLTTGQCELDTRGPYCLGCAGGVASDDCGDFGNYCLTDSVNGGEFCGVDCYAGEACPQGYGCSDVIIIPPSAPFCTFPEICVIADGAGSGVCSRSTGTACVQDEDCPEGPPGGDCHIQTNGRFGSCALDPNINCQSDADCTSVDGDECIRIECRGGEGDSFGHCTCTRDSDCPVDVCVGADLSDPNNPVQGHCELSGHDCFEAFECDIITCVEGGCLIGANCAPSNDRSCRDLDVTPAPPAE